MKYIQSNLVRSSEKPELTRQPALMQAIKLSRDVFVDYYLKQQPGHVLLILAAPVDTSGVCKTRQRLKLLFCLENAFVMEVMGRKPQRVFNSCLRKEERYISIVDM